MLCEVCGKCAVYRRKKNWDGWGHIIDISLKFCLLTTGGNGNSDLKYIVFGVHLLSVVKKTNVSRPWKEYSVAEINLKSSIDIHYFALNTLDLNHMYVQKRSDSVLFIGSNPNIYIFIFLSKTPKVSQSTSPKIVYQNNMKHLRQETIHILSRGAYHFIHNIYKVPVLKYHILEYT